MPLLFSLSQPRSKLRKSILKTFSGREVTFDQIYKEHSVDTRYISKNYREVLKELEENKIISAYSTKGKRRKGTYPDHVRIKFPGEGTDVN